MIQFMQVSESTYLIHYLIHYRRRLRRVIADPQTTPPSNLRVLFEHLHLRKARHVEVKARVTAMTFAMNSAC